MFPQIFGNGAMATWLRRTRPKGGLRITSLLRSSAVPPKELIWPVPEAGSPASYIPRIRSG